MKEGERSTIEEENEAAFMEGRKIEREREVRWKKMKLPLGEWGGR